MPTYLRQTVTHLVSVNFLCTGKICQLAVACIGDVDTVRGDISVDEALFVQENDR